MPQLRSRWMKLTSSYSADKSLREEFWSEIENNYCDRKRHYHNLDHLKYMFQKAEEYSGNLRDEDVIYFSIFYHDIIYRSHRQDNEKKSAELAAKRMKELGVPHNMIERCHEQILLTKDHKDSGDPDIAFLLDLDLAILGESHKVYEDYTRKIRKEYAVFPDFLYKKGRIKVLQYFLSLPCIFKTEKFRKNYEVQARKNIEQELSSL